MTRFVLFLICVLCVSGCGTSVPTEEPLFVAQPNEFPREVRYEFVMADEDAGNTNTQLRIFREAVEEWQRAIPQAHISLTIVPQPENDPNKPLWAFTNVEGQQNDGFGADRETYRSGDNLLLQRAPVGSNEQCLLSDFLRGIGLVLGNVSYGEFLPVEGNGVMRPSNECVTWVTQSDADWLIERQLGGDGL